MSAGIVKYPPLVSPILVNSVNTASFINKLDEIIHDSSLLIQKRPELYYRFTVISGTRSQRKFRYVNALHLVKIQLPDLNAGSPLLIRTSDGK